MESRPTFDTSPVTSRRPGYMSSSSLVDIVEVTQGRAAEVCLHCGHEMAQHSRRRHRARMRYSCHDGKCACAYDLVYIE